MTINESSPISKEENILRYACDYVAIKLKKRFVKIPGEKSVRFVEEQ